LNPANIPTLVKALLSWKTDLRAWMTRPYKITQMDVKTNAKSTETWSAQKFSNVLGNDLDVIVNKKAGALAVEDFNYKMWVGFKSEL
jgi:hypothetical protein